MIIGPLFETQRIGVPTPAAQDQQQPGKIGDGASGVGYQDEHDAAMCAERERGSHNSGMGEIFRRVAAVAPLKVAPDRLGVRWKRVALLAGGADRGRHGRLR